MNKEIVTVTESSVACEGNAPATGHPKVFLTFKADQKEVVCPYCSRTFVRAAGAVSSAAH